MGHLLVRVRVRVTVRVTVRENLVFRNVCWCSDSEKWARALAATSRKEVSGDGLEARDLDERGFHMHEMNIWLCMELVWCILSEGRPQWEELLPTETLV